VLPILPTRHNTLTLPECNNPAQLPADTTDRRPPIQSISQVDTSALLTPMSRASSSDLDSTSSSSTAATSPLNVQVAVVLPQIHKGQEHSDPELGNIQDALTPGVELEKNGESAFNVPDTVVHSQAPIIATGCGPCNSGPHGQGTKIIPAPDMSRAGSSRPRVTSSLSLSTVITSPLNVPDDVVFRPSCSPVHPEIPKRQETLTTKSDDNEEHGRQQLIQKLENSGDHEHRTLTLKLGNNGEPQGMREAMKERQESLLQELSAVLDEQEVITMKSGDFESVQRNLFLTEQLQSRIKEDDQLKAMVESKIQRTRAVFAKILCEKQKKFAETLEEKEKSIKDAFRKGEKSMEDTLREKVESMGEQVKSAEQRAQQAEHNVRIREEAKWQIQMKVAEIAAHDKRVALDKRISDLEVETGECREIRKKLQDAECFSEEILKQIAQLNEESLKVPESRTDIERLEAKTKPLQAQNKEQAEVLKSAGREAQASQSKFEELRTKFNELRDNYKLEKKAKEIREERESRLAALAKETSTKLEKAERKKEKAEEYKAKMRVALGEAETRDRETQLVLEAREILISCLRRDLESARKTWWSFCLVIFVLIAALVFTLSTGSV
jgi:hypothetical protein